MTEGPAEQENAETEDAELSTTSAAQWWVRLDAGALSASELRAFRAWLAGDPRNERGLRGGLRPRGAVERAPKALAAAYVAESAPPPRRRWLVPAAAAVAACLALALAYEPLWLLWRADFRTATGELRTVTLPDGSRAHMNADTALALDYGGDRRRLSLLAGEAWFEVEPDPSRPFVVEAAGAEIAARGTAFDIATDKISTEVTVTEHAVEVTGAGAAAAGGGRAPNGLRAGPFRRRAL